MLWGKFCVKCKETNVPFAVILIGARNRSVPHAKRLLSAAANFGYVVLQYFLSQSTNGRTKVVSCLSIVFCWIHAFFAVLSTSTSRARAC